ncbi:SDR family NAD(P)-dependent oxidoreductase [Halorubellus salinus]|uniref:SDR family NAD(P)-dependent oxidoreductase n=1 Tax=Halorubellus salinus TaxID=755309 RepID=UPI001D07C263|nr:SDR family NAD(P)-dependent oxidoreductase [Halorubellus salinus]
MTDVERDAVSYSLDGEVAVVTGGTRGIGLAISEAFAVAGATVVPTSRTAADVDAAVERVEATGADGLAVPTDVTDPDAVAHLFAETVDAFGGVDVLVNNAGVNPDGALGKPQDVTDDEFGFTVDVNLRGAARCLAAAARRFEDSPDGGVIVNVASVGGVVGLPRQHPYVASKHGIVGLTKSAALDLAPSVRVNAVAPGYVKTDLIDGIRENDDLRASVLDRTPLDRFAEPAEIAAAVLFLASDASSYVTGTTLAVDGGWTAQ